MDVRPGASNPHKVIVKRRAVDSVGVTLAVVDGEYITLPVLTSSCELESDETNILRSTEARTFQSPNNCKV